MAKKYDRDWRKCQQDWRRRDTHIIEKVHLFLAREKMRMAYGHGHQSHTKPTRHPAIISGSSSSPFRINRQHPLWSSFPITWFNGRRPPNWENLSQWGKVQLSLIPLHELGCITFTGNLNPALESRLVNENRDITAFLRNRLRKNLRAVTGVENLEFVFVLEGHTKGKAHKTHLHIHGVVASDRLPDTPRDRAMVREAVAKTVGQWKRGRIEPYSVQTTPYWRPGKRYANYLFENMSRKDDRIGYHRLAFSRSLNAATHEFWLAIAGLDGTRKVPRNARRVARSSFAGKIVHARQAVRKRLSRRQSEAMRFHHAMRRLAKAAKKVAASP